MNSFEWLKKLVSFDTTSRNSNLELIAAIQQWFSTYHIPVRLTHNANKEKANLFATLPAHDGTVTGGIVLSGHTDVVPVDGQDWKTNPFSATVVNDVIYGRGTSDMKSFIAVVLALLPEFKQAKLHKPLHFAFSYDEEIGCLGAPGLIADMQAHGIQPQACIVGEPTEMRPVTAHKGISLFRCRVHGNAAHSSLTPEGCNAIDYAAELICQIRAIANRIREQGPQDKYYDIPFTSISTNLVNGGNAVNTVPAICEFLFEIRNLPHINPDTFCEEIQNYIDKILLPKMRNESPKGFVEIELIASVPGLQTAEEGDITQLMRNLTKEQAIRKVAYATEAGLFHQAGIPTIVCGPGSIEQAHKANEFITVEQIQKCELFLNNLVKQFLEKG